MGETHSVIFSSHILSEVENICDRVHILNKGKVVFSDSISGLKNFRDQNSVEIRLMRPPSDQALKEIVSDGKIKQLDANTFRITSIEADLCDSLVAASVEKNWGLSQLITTQASLEEVFVQLTKQDEINAPDNGTEEIRE